MIWIFIIIEQLKEGVWKLVAKKEIGAKKVSKSLICQLFQLKPVNAIS